ncbi:MAG: ABC transporter ATP-binding protein [Myxococcota bacterium]
MLLDIEELSVTFESEQGAVPAVRGASFRLAQGEAAALVGESGSGKSVSAMALLRLLPASAHIRSRLLMFDGRNLSALSEPELRRVRGREIGMVFQEPMSSLNPVFAIGNQIAEVLTLHRGLDRRAADAEVVKLLGRVGIPSPEQRSKQYPHELSGGMKQRAMIAMALACQPKLLIADEPTTALDVTIQAQILALLKNLQTELKMAVLLITHDLGVVAHFAENVHVMYAGKIVEHASTRDLFAAPQHPYTQALLAALPKPGNEGARLEAIPGRVPAPSRLPKGCAFSPRCKFVMEHCPHDQPPLIPAKEGHEAACWLLEGKST